MTFASFEARVRPVADALDDRLLRYISSPQEHDLAAPTEWPLFWLLFSRRVRTDA